MDQRDVVCIGSLFDPEKAIGFLAFDTLQTAVYGPTAAQDAATNDATPQDIAGAGALVAQTGMPQTTAIAIAQQVDQATGVSVPPSSPTTPSSLGGGGGALPRASGGGTISIAHPAANLSPTGKAVGLAIVGGLTWWVGKARGWW